MKNEIYEGQIYYDSTFDCNLQIVDVGEDLIKMRDTELIEERGDDDGNPYRRWMFEQNIRAGRFTLKEDIDEERKEEQVVEELDSAENIEEPEEAEDSIFSF